MGKPTDLSETTLFKKLQALASQTNISNTDEENRQKAITLVRHVAAEASAQATRIPCNFSEFTRHDESHSLGVVYLMGKILDVSGSLNELSYLEITLLILAAYLHDIGMAPPEERKQEIQAEQDFKKFAAIRREELPNLKELSQAIQNPDLTRQEHARHAEAITVLEQRILMEYLRSKHADLSKEFILETYSTNPMWEFEHYNICATVADVCQGHVLHSRQLTEEFKSSYPRDKLVGDMAVNVLFCTVLLRLADILDFDRHRTPEILFKSIAPRSPVSINEWEKHRSVIGWKISEDSIQVECECTHPLYQKTVYEFLDRIDEEIQNALMVVRNFPGTDGIADRYRLKLQRIVDRSRVRPKNNAYVYVDVSFQLSHTEIMNLLMGRELWGDPSFCIRELIQNAYDAIRHRRALVQAAGEEWNAGKITLFQRVNHEGKLEVECQDNGMGMNRDIVERYFFKVGKSYYRSSEFEQERLGLREKSVDFDPISKFGLGIVSTFMIGDSLRIETQRYRGPAQGCDRGLNIEIEGHGGMAIIRELDKDRAQPGTKVTVIGAEASPEDLADPWYDPVRLSEVTQFYAAALDIPVEVIVERPFRECRVPIPPQARPLELAVGLQSKLPEDSYHIESRQLSELGDGTDGTLKILFLKDGAGRVCTANDFAEFEPKTEIVGEGEVRSIELRRLSDRKEMEHELWNRWVLAQDGILLDQWDYKRSRLGGSSMSLMLRFPGSLFVNLSGRAKLPLKLDRTLLKESESGLPVHSFQTFSSQLDRIISAIFADVIRDDTTRPLLCNFWAIVEVYGFDLLAFPKALAYEHVPVPCLLPDQTETTEINSLAALRRRGIRKAVLCDQPHSAIKDAVSVSTAEQYLPALIRHSGGISDHLKCLLRAITVLHVESGQTAFEIEPLATPFQTLGDSIIRYPWTLGPYRLDLYLQSYSRDLQDYFAVHNPLRGINRGHGVAEFLIKTTGLTEEQHDRFAHVMSLVTNFLAVDQSFDVKPAEEWEFHTRVAIRKAIHHWKRIRWDQLPGAAQPPYMILFPQSGRTHEITLEYLEKKLREAGVPAEPAPPEAWDLS